MVDWMDLASRNNDLKWKVIDKPQTEQILKPAPKENKMKTTFNYEEKHWMG